MKKIRFFLYLVLTGLIFFSACEKDDVNPLTSDESAKKSHGKMNNAIMVYPEGPEFDTENLMAAFQEAKEKGPGQTILLAEGEFYLDEMEIFEFEGTLRGSGIGKTVIHPLPDGINISDTSPFGIDKAPFFITFYGGDITVSDMSFEVLIENPTKPSELYTGDIVTFIGGVLVIQGKSLEEYEANACFKNLSFRGKYVGLFDYTAYNVDNFIIFGGGPPPYPLKGNCVVQNCYFEEAEQGFLSFGNHSSTITVGGSPSKANHFKNLEIGVFCVHGEGNITKVAFNKIEDVGNRAGINIVLDNIFPPEWKYKAGPCKFHVHDNVIEVDGMYGDGMRLFDYAAINDGSLASEMHIKKNNIILSGGGYEAGIWSIGIHNAKFISNKISGNGNKGFAFDGPNRTCHLINNNLRELDATTTDIYLSPWTSDFKIVCERGITDISDEGTNNKIVGPYMKGNASSMENKSEKALGKKRMMVY